MQGLRVQGLGFKDQTSGLSSFRGVPFAFRGM